MGRQFARFLMDEDGATAIEYGLMAAIIGGALLTGLGAFSNKLNGQFLGISNTIDNAWAGN
jgi:pilus assembly protein Flp/PilA